VYHGTSPTLAGLGPELFPVSRFHVGDSKLRRLLGWRVRDCDDLAPSCKHVEIALPPAVGSTFSKRSELEDEIGGEDTARQTQFVQSAWLADPPLEVDLLLWLAILESIAFAEGTTWD